jgi:hypothetical protein
MILEIVTVGSIISAAAVGYIAYVQYKKNEEYERAIVEFYSAVALVLHTMRIIDEKKMFEEDDEVGSVFQQLVELVNELRPIAYGIENADRPTKE